MGYKFFLLIFIFFIFFHLPLNAFIWKQDIDIDFNTGIFSNTVVQGTGTNAYIRINPFGWSNINPAIKPSARNYHAMCYDNINQKVLLFGGYNGANNDETWAYDLTQNKWTNMNPSVKPSARRSHAMCYDNINQKILLFGGFDGALDDETWIYDLVQNKWTNMNPPVKPSTRGNHTMCYDSINQKALLFGGFDSSPYSDETWAYDLVQNKWTNMNPPVKPSARDYHVMCYDSINQKVLLFGGYDGTYDDETWIYDLVQNKWTNMNPSVKPSARRSYAMCYDNVNQKIFLFGGYDGALDDETWAYDLAQNKWTNMNLTVKPSGRFDHTMCYDSINQKALLFGGYDGIYYDETWVFSMNKKGIYESTHLNAGSSSVFEKISFSNISLPAVSTQKFQVSTSSLSNGPWNFLGPDGTSTTFYINSGESIWSSHANKPYIKYKVYFSTSDPAQSPELGWISIEYKEQSPSQPASDTPEEIYDNLDNAALAPNPLKLNSVNGNNYINFYHLTPEFTIKVYSISGGEIAQFNSWSNNGKYTWYITNSNGKNLKPGLYLCYIKNPKGQSKILKLLIN